MNGSGCLRFGVVGAGIIADTHMGPAIRRAAGCEIVAAYARKPRKAEDFAARHEAQRWYADWHALLDDPEVDAVYIATPPYQHAEQTVAAAQAGKHVLCEKPMAISLDECDEMITACREAGVCLGICLGWRFHPVYQRMRVLVAEGFLGEPRLAEARIAIDLPDKGPRAFRLRPELGGGGAMIDIGVHCVDTLCYLLDRDVKSVAAFSDHDPAVYPSDLTTVAALRFEGDLPGVVRVSFDVSFRRHGVDLYGSVGNLFNEQALRTDTPARLTCATAEGVREEEIHAYDQYQALVEEFVAAVRAGRAPVPGGPEGRSSQAIALAAYESIRTGRIVHLREKG